MMFNAYQFLGLDEHANVSQIESALQQAQASGKIPPETVEKLSQCLLNPENKAHYDAQLQMYLQSDEYAFAQLNQIHLPTVNVNDLILPNAQNIAANDVSVGVHVSEALVPNAVPIQSLSEHWVSEADKLDVLLGASQAHYYASEFQRLEQGQTPRFNGAAFLGGGYWLCAKGMWSKGLLLLMAPVALWALFALFIEFWLANSKDGTTLPMAIFAVMVLAWAAYRLLYMPKRANAIYHAFAKRRISTLSQKYPQQPNRLLDHLGSTNSPLIAGVLLIGFGLFWVFVLMGVLWGFGLL